jgi:hypothetical protein
MKLKIELSLSVPPVNAFKRWSFRVGVPLLIVCAVGAARADSPRPWNKGDTLTADDLNAAFSAVNPGCASAWKTFTPVVSSVQGSIGSASSSLRYCTLGKTVHFAGQVNVSNNGTGSLVLNVSLPIPGRADTAYPGSGRAEDNGYMLQAIVRGSTIGLLTYDNVYPAGFGTLLFGGTYETE